MEAASDDANDVTVLKAILNADSSAYTPLLSDVNNVTPTTLIADAHQQVYLFMPTLVPQREIKYPAGVCSTVILLQNT